MASSTSSEHLFAAADNAEISLTLYEEGSRASRRTPVRVLLDVEQPELSRSVLTALQQSNVEISIGVDATNSASLPPNVVITDSLSRVHQHSVLIADGSPGTAQRGMSLMVAGKLGAMVSLHQIDDIDLVVSAVSQGYVCAPQTIVQVASDAPVVDSRQLAVLELIFLGCSNGVIAKRLRVSDATVKREVSALLRLFACTTRIELALLAAKAGYS